jgi:hypothetical protein
MISKRTVRTGSNESMRAKSDGSSPFPQYKSRTSLCKNADDPWHCWLKARQNVQRIFYWKQRRALLVRFGMVPRIIRSSFFFALLFLVTTFSPSFSISWCVKESLDSDLSRWRTRIARRNSRGISVRPAARVKLR